MPDAQTAPMYSCPSPPMFQMPIRNATAAASPVSSRGVALTSVCEIALVLVTDACSIAL